ncbi:hypothetical protein [Scytonema sp. HK-05]|uniref:hypothetical protein n=1 Tax=Scytonema sp. HK-05 TaxID=1137095 RepID=UPI003075F2C1
MSNNTDVKTILLLAANPRNTSQLRLDEEVREIDEGLRRANKREQFKLEQKWAVRWHGVPAFGDRAIFTEQSWTLSPRLFTSADTVLLKMALCWRMTRGK